MPRASWSKIRHALGDAKLGLLFFDDRALTDSSSAPPRADVCGFIESTPQRRALHHDASATAKTRFAGWAAPTTSESPVDQTGMRPGGSRQNESRPYCRDAHRHLVLQG